MPFDPILAAVRFGTGLSPVIAPPSSVAGMLADLGGPDAAAADHPIPRFAEAAPTVATFRDINRARREAAGTARADALRATYEATAEAARALWLDGFGATLARWVTAQGGLRERLVGFWANHFTVRAKNATTTHLVTPYVEEAIRPHVTGRFADLLRAAITHPMMLGYLDQSQSMGPNSQAALRRDRGLNENLARELLELHTLGVGGPYTQGDVRELAELLTGLGWDIDGGGMVYRPTQAEPGAETVLGTTFPAAADLTTIHAALDALAAHPATAGHIAFKLARHFVADDPPADLVGALAGTFRATGGDLLAVTAALLEHPAAWSPVRAKVRPPFAFLAAALRALDVPVAAIRLTDLREARRRFLIPLGVMGQPWEAPPGPDGWPDDAAAWVTPQFMAGRIDWAMRVPERLLAALPDPRALAPAALGAVPEEVAFAAAAAEDRAVGVGVVLASAAFQRR